MANIKITKVLATSKKKPFLFFLLLIFSFIQTYSKSTTHRFSNNDDVLIDSLKNLGNAKVKQGDYDQAFTFYFKALEIAEKNNNLKSISDLYNNLGVGYNDLKKYDRATEYHLRALKIRKELGLKKEVGASLQNLGNIYYNKMEDSTAMSYYQQALKIQKQIGDRSNEATSLIDIAGIYVDQEKDDEAIKFTLQALTIRKELGEQNRLARIYENLGDMLSMKGDHSGALKYFDAALTIADSLNAKRDMMQIYESYSNTYEQMKDPVNALKYFKLFTSYKDSVFNENNNNQINELVTKYETEKKEKENALLSAGIKTKEKQLLKEKTKFFVSIGLLLFVATISVLLYNRNKLKQNKIFSEQMLKQEKLRLKAVILTQETERKRIALELHDGLGQMLSAARLNVAALDGKNGNSKNQYNNALILIDDSCRELRNISHDMMPALLVKSGLVSAVEELASKSGSSSLVIHIDHDGNIGRMPPETEINIFRIIQELLNNIIKYAQATEVHIQFIREDNYLSFLIEDNGKGFNKNILATSKGNGWHNIQSRLELIQGKIEIDSKPLNGTVIHIEVPLKTKMDIIAYEKA